MVKISLGFLSVIAGFGILGFVIFTIGIGKIAEILSQFSPWGVIPLLGLTLLSHIVSAVRWQYILRALGVRAPFILLIQTWFVGNAVSYITPVAYVGGEFFRAAILRDRHGVAWTRALSSIFIDKVVESVVWISIVLLGGAIFVFQLGLSSVSESLAVGLTAILFFAGFIAVVYVFILKKKSLVQLLFVKFLKRGDSKMGTFLYDIEKDFFQFFSIANKMYVLRTVGFALLKYAILLVRNIFLIYYLTQVLSLSSSIMALGFSYLSYIAPVPAGIGAQEGLLSLVFARIGFVAGIGAAFTLLWRGAEMMIVGLGLYFLVRWGLRKFALRVTECAKGSPSNGNGTKSLTGV